MFVTNLNQAPIRIFESLDSTMHQAAEYARKSYDEGLAVMAHEQTAGRGRRGRQWLSNPEAGLWATLLLRPSRGQEDWPSLGLVFAVSLAQTLESVTGEKFQLKWPNDIWYREAKLAGILMEAIHEGSALALGFGINYTTPQAAKDAPLRHPAIGLNATTDGVPKPQKLLELIRENLSAPYNGWNLGQWESSRQAFEERDLLRDTPIRWRDNGEQSEGIGRGIDEHGRLRVEMSDGALNYLSAAEVDRISKT